MKQLVFCFLFCITSFARGAEECVIILHGWGQFTDAMHEMESRLQNAGYRVINNRYQTRESPIEKLAKTIVAREVSTCHEEGYGSISFVTHSMGAMVLRVYLQENELPELTRVVMLAPPNHGVIMVDYLSGLPGFNFIAGPAGTELGTGQEGIHALLEPVDFELGIIAGSSNYNPLSLALVGEPNDGLVTVESTRIAGMNAHLVLPVTHSLMMRNNEVIDNTVHFLKTGTFIPDPNQ